MENMIYERALLIAIKAHAEQKRWNGEPYVCHPVRVAARVAAAMAGTHPADRVEVHKIAAVLHDTVEDTEVTLDEIRATFGGEIAEAVDYLTRREGESYEDFVDRCSRNQIALRVSERDKKYAAARQKLSALLRVSETNTSA